MTITKNGKQVVKVSIQPGPTETNLNPDTLLYARMNAWFKEAEPAQIDLMKRAWQAAKAKQPILRIEGAKPTPQTHSQYPKLRELMLEAGTADTPPNLVRTLLDKAYVLAGKILNDIPKDVTRDTDQKSPTKMDPAWGAKLDELLARFMSLSTQLADTSAGSLFLTTGPIADLDKAVASIKEGDRNKVKRLLALAINSEWGFRAPRSARFGSMNSRTSRPERSDRS